MVFAGSGESGPFIDKVVERAWEDVQLATSFDEACIASEESIKRTHKEYGQIFQPGYLPLVRLVYGVKMHGKSKLFSADQAVVVECDGSQSHGTGSAFATFIARQMYELHLPISQLVILAAYTIFQAKVHADGCGGDTHIAKLVNSGGSKRINAQEVQWIESHIHALEMFLGTAFLSNADLDTDDSMVAAHIELFCTQLRLTREEQRKERERIRHFMMKVKELDAQRKAVREWSEKRAQEQEPPTQSGSQKSEPEP
jgi:hypothetical protein